MTTAASASIISQTSNANMQAWTGEIVGQLIACGLLQTQDTGQTTISGSGASATTACTVPTLTGITHATGYVVFTFPDAPAKGGISTVSNKAGTGYTNSAAFTGIVVTGVTSSAVGARASCTIGGGGVPGAMTITTASSGYIAGEQLTYSGGTDGAGHTFTTAGTAVLGMPTVLTSGSPVVFRLDFGAGTSTAVPTYWITVGSGSNGSGTINGSAGTTAMTAVACCTSSTPASATTAYTSYFCWNSTYSFAKVVSKNGAGNSSTAFGGFYLFRTNDTTGAPTASGVIMLTNYYTASGSQITTGQMQCATYGAGVISSIAPATLSSTAGGGWLAANPGVAAAAPFGLTSTLSSGNVTIFPIMYLVGGVFSYSAFMGVASLDDIPVGSTCSSAIIGSTALTFLADQLGMFGGQYLGNLNTSLLIPVTLWM